MVLALSFPGSQVCGHARGLPSKTGIGLRNPHLAYVRDNLPCVPWFEVHSENFSFEDGETASTQPHMLLLQEIASNYPLSFHGVGLSLGSASPLDTAHLGRLRRAIDHFNPVSVSEHLSWSRTTGRHFNDLLPLPYTAECLGIFCDHVKQTQDYLGTRILVENPSTYLEFSDSCIPEWDFFASLPKQCGCGLLLDVNNIVVNAHNHNFDPYNYLNAIDFDDVGEIHLAGHTRKTVQNTEILIDDHGSRVPPEVLQLFGEVIGRGGLKPALIEWDTNIPQFPVLLEECQQAQSLLDAHDTHGQIPRNASLGCGLTRAKTAARI